jgi:hypothetical protein
MLLPHAQNFRYIYYADAMSRAQILTYLYTSRTFYRQEHKQTNTVKVVYTKWNALIAHLST